MTNGFWFTDEQQAIRDGVLRLCAKFDAEYWRKTDETGRFPEEFVAAMAEAGWLGAAMPTELGGSGLGVTEAAIAMQAVAESGAGFSGASAIHLNIFGPMPLAKFGTAEQKQKLIPSLIAGTDRMCFGVTEPNAGLDTTSLTFEQWLICAGLGVTILVASEIWKAVSRNMSLAHGHHE